MCMLYATSFLIERYEKEKPFTTPSYIYKLKSLILTIKSIVSI